MFAVIDIFRVSHLAAWDWLVWLWLGSRWLSLACLCATILVLAFTRWPYRRMVFFGFLGLGIAASLAATVARSKGAFAADSSGIIFVLSAFLPIGFTFRQSLVAALIIAVFSILLILFGPEHRPWADAAQLSLMLLTAIPIGAAGGYVREQADREQFLARNRLQELASKDGLTGIANRRAFDDHLTVALREARRSDVAVVLALVDLDYFKTFNDEYGHPAGDEVLRKVAMQLSNGIRRPMDIAARIGGEEFGILLYGASLEPAFAILEQIATNIRALEIDHCHAPQQVVTVSIGAVEWRGEDALDLISRADKALYLAKKSGRAQVVAVRHDDAGEPSA
ncbi:GGDEF domain-containing protein [Streptomyces sp. NPDC051577]|uniref:GGDEF domain-containing protein n=1 Tax=Streptomyces sp. NPDC051577 TaxID=3155166 RepID=UPI003438AE19